MRIIILGAPGAGKGTQAGYIGARLGIPAISTGNIFREVIASGSELGETLRRYIDAGQLVPDGIVMDAIKHRLEQPDCAGGFILDGFPRTLAQAQALDEMGVTIDAVVDIEVPDDEIIGRMGGRRVCPCGASYHIRYNPPRRSGRCDACGDVLSMRADDAPDTVKARLRVYHSQTESLKAYYRDRGTYVTVIGQDDPADTRALTMAALGIETD